MELEELHVGDLGAGAIGQGDAVAGGDRGVGADLEELAGAAGGQDQEAAGELQLGVGAAVQGLDALQNAVV